MLKSKNTQASFRKHFEQAATEPELHLLAERDLKSEWFRQRTAAAGTIGFHVVAIIVLAIVPWGNVPPPPPDREFIRHVTPLFIPPDLTQKAPNKEPLKKELTLASIAPHPVMQAPAPAPVGKKAQANKPMAMPPPPPPPVQTSAKTVPIEPPKIDAPVQNLQTVQIPKTNATPLPPANTPPKVALEEVSPLQRSNGTGKPTGLIPMPSSSIADAVRNVTRGGAQRGVAVGDADENGNGGGLNLPPSAGRPHSNLELLSDPMGVDFRPYMTQVLASVRRSWFAVYPEAARLGQRGQVVLQFSIAKQGAVAKVIFTGQSGAKALDQAAVAAISASNPLPPLPADFKGDRIVLQLTFSYNMPR